MKIKAFLYSTLISCLLAACGDNGIASDEPDGDGSSSLSISFTLDDYGQGVLRGRAHNPDYCWNEDGWNERTVNALDFFLIKENAVTFHQHVTVSKSDCEKDVTLFDAEKTDNIITGLTYDKVREADMVLLVANADLASSDPVGSTLTNLYKNLSGLQHDRQQASFVMEGSFEIPDNLKYNADITIPLQRIAAKIRLTLLKSDKTTVITPDKFKSALCHYVTDAQVMPENQPTVTTDRVLDSSGLFTASVTAHGGEDSKPESHSLTHSNGHVYYTYPSDWIDYSKFKKQCSNKDKDGHNGHTDDNRYEIADYDDRAPIREDREMYLIIEAPFNTTNYFYKVPVNYRLYENNDRQCFSENEIKNSIFPLYRVGRNCFYDITATIDRKGGESPELAILLSVAPLADGGTYDYIY